MMDEDYAYERQRQRRLDNVSEELDALQVLRREVVHMSHFQFGFLCTALDSVRPCLSEAQHNFLQQKIRRMLNGNAVIPMDIEGSPHHKYLDNNVMFAAMSHAYRLGIIDQWITNQKEKEND